MNLTWKILNPSKWLTPEEQSKGFKIACDEWAKYSSLTFTEIPKDSSEVPQIGIEFSTDVTTSSSLAWGTYYTNRINDIKFNEYRNAFAMTQSTTLAYNVTPWLYSPTSTVKAYVWSYPHVCMHELGHALGLTHTTFYSNVMYRTYNARTKLGLSDIAAIGKKYPKLI